MLDFPKYIREIHSIAFRWRNLGEFRCTDGTLLIGRLPKKGAGAYLHRLFSPLSVQEIFQLSMLVRARIPAQLVEFYHYHNGCNLFVTNLTVYGLRRSFDRGDFDAMSSNPFDLRVQSLTHIKDSPSGAGFCFSKYKDGTLLFLEEDGTVVRCHEESRGTILNAWPSFADWIVSEAERVAGFFDEFGGSNYNEADIVPVGQSLF